MSIKPSILSYIRTYIDSTYACSCEHTYMYTYLHKYIHVCVHTYVMVPSGRATDSKMIVQVGSLCN